MMADNAEGRVLAVNGREYTVIRLLGKGKGVILIWFPVGLNIMC